MAYKKFEELPAWRAAADLAVQVLDWSERDVFRGRPGLRDQMERAAISVSNNIAEGYERGSSAELLTFLYYARGSAGEVRSMLGVMGRSRAWEEMAGEVRNLIDLSSNIARQLGAWIESVKDSDYAGNRHQNSATRDARDVARRQSAFLEELKRVAQEGRKDWPGKPESS